MTMDKLKNSWWNCVANEVNRQPRAPTNPPRIAVNRNDFFLHMAMKIGDASSVTHVDIAPRNTGEGEMHMIKRGRVTLNGKQLQMYLMYRVFTDEKCKTGVKEESKRKELINHWTSVTSFHSVAAFPHTRGNWFTLCVKRRKQQQQQQRMILSLHFIGVVSGVNEYAQAQKSNPVKLLLNHTYLSCIAMYSLSLSSFLFLCLGREHSHRSNTHKSLYSRRHNINNHSVTHEWHKKGLASSIQRERGRRRGRSFFHFKFFTLKRQVNLKRRDHHFSRDSSGDAHTQCIH